LLSLESVFDNVGDAETGFRVVFRARGGTVSGPVIENKNTGEAVRMRPDFVMQPGDMMEALIYPNLVRVLINGATDGFAYLDTQSDFFRLPPGHNHLAYNAAENVSNLDVAVMYVPRFLTV